jgi:hypothetical protein
LGELDLELDNIFLGRRECNLFNLCKVDKTQMGKDSMLLGLYLLDTCNLLDISIEYNLLFLQDSSSQLDRQCNLIRRALIGIIQQDN